MKTLRQFRIEKGETLEQVATALGTKTGNVSKWELGESSPRPRYVPKIAEHFGITPQEAREAVEASKAAVAN